MSLHYTAYNESVFRASVEEALKRVQSILDTTRHPRLAQDDDEHKNYEDKYSLADFLTNSANAALLHVLQQFDHFGLNGESEKLAQVVKWVVEDKKTVTLRFQATDGCSLIKEQEVKIASPHQYETETTTMTTNSGSPTTTDAAAGADDSTKKETGGGGGGGGAKKLRNLLVTGSTSSSSSTTKTEKTTTRVTRTIKEYHWKVEVSYKLSIFSGDASSADAENCSVVELESRNVVATVVTAGGGSGAGTGSRSRHATPPIRDKTVHAPIDVNLTWLFSTLDNNNSNNNINIASPRFTIERNDVETCKTPRRNVQVQNAVDMYGELSQWATKVRAFLVQRLARTIDASHQPSNTSSGGGGGDGAAAAAAAISLTCPSGHNSPFLTVVPPDTVYACDICSLHLHPGTQMYCCKVCPGESWSVCANHGGGGGLPPPPSSSRDNDKPAAMPLWELDNTARSIFVPILPLMENGSILSEDDANKLLNAQMRSMQQAIEKIDQMYPPKHNMAKVISTLEATLVVLSHHLNDISRMYHYSVDYIEEMLRNQLIQAIGKEVHPKDFDQFMNFYYKKLFAARYTPKPFTYAIRQPNHYPDGILSVEDISTTWTSGNSNKVEPVASLVRHIPAVHHDDGHGTTPSIFIPINAATSVEITGDRYIHGWMQHRFQSAPTSSCGPMATEQYQLAARARQFCSFMIIVGNMAGPDIFQPKEAIILQNKDEVLIPLITKVLPSAKEFKDAIASLSPQQQAFAKAFRSMQLETSVFGVCVMQIKPQLEKLLGLPSGALTKEIQLTQDLMSLFVDYQIPSDLLSFDASSSPDSSSSSTEMTMVAKLAAVKGHVKSVMDVLEAAKEKQLIEEERKADIREQMMPQSFASPFGHLMDARSHQDMMMMSSGGRGQKLGMYQQGGGGSVAGWQRQHGGGGGAYAGPNLLDIKYQMAMPGGGGGMMMEHIGGVMLPSKTNPQARNYVPQKQVGLDKVGPQSPVAAMNIHGHQQQQQPQQQQGFPSFPDMSPTQQQQQRHHQQLMQQQQQLMLQAHQQQQQNQPQLHSMQQHMQQQHQQPSSTSHHHQQQQGMPKLPLSAYNLFFRQTRMQLLGDEVSQEFQITDQSKRRHRTSHGKIGFKELATQIGSNWKNLQGPERKVYEDQARLEKLRYEKELEEWKKAGGSSKPPPLASSSPPHPPSSSLASLPSSATTPGGGGTGGEEKDDSPSTMMTTDSSTERQQQHVGTESPSKKEAADALAGLSDEVSAAKQQQHRMGQQQQQQQQNMSYMGVGVGGGGPSPLSPPFSRQALSMDSSVAGLTPGGGSTVEDYTMIPKLLDAKLEAFDTDNSLRPTIIEAGTTWTRKRQENLLTSAQMSSLDPSVIQDEKKKAFDLLDALSRSGTLPIDCAELHVMVGVTHCFENDVIGTVIQDNINPIHKVEKSLLMLASTIFREPANALLHDDVQLQQRLTASFPQLFLESDQQE